jgi:hypothetical protein
MKEITDLNLVCYSGGAEGADMYFDKTGRNYGITTLHYSYKTEFHESVPDKRELSKEEFELGKEKVILANNILKRPLARYMNLLSRNYFIIRDAGIVLAIGKKIMKKGTPSNPSEYDIVKGGTGVAVMLACLEPGKKIYVYDQSVDKWFDWSYLLKSFREYPGTPIIDTDAFAGIGTRELTDKGKEAIKKIFEKTLRWKSAQANK